MYKCACGAEMEHTAASPETGTILVKHGDDQYSTLPGEAGRWEVFAWIGKLHDEARRAEAIRLGLPDPGKKKSRKRVGAKS